MSAQFGLPLLQAISDWQRSATTSRAQTLKSMCVDLPDEYRACQFVCYRQIAFLSLYPPPGSVIVNLSKLYQNPAFSDAMKQNSADIVGYGNGAGRWGNSQSEVVLEIDAVTPEDIYALGGHSSPLDELVVQAGDLVYQRPSTQEEQHALFLQAEQAAITAGPKWLSMDATRRVLANTKPQAERLSEIKRQQKNES